MKIAVINSGSSSVKFKLFVMPQEKLLAHIVVEKIAEPISFITLRYKKNKHAIQRVIQNHAEALAIIDLLLREYKIIRDFTLLDVVAHRVVHGGDVFHGITFIDEDVLKKIAALAVLAPLHNKANVEGIIAIRKKAPKIRQIAVFDTAFHTTMPKEAYLYALPYVLYEKQRVRRYGFHGISHAYVMKEAAKEMRKDPQELNMITLHLGNGASACAIQKGKSMDTSMGFTPLEGLVMGSRCGDIDPSIVLYLQRELGYTVDEVDTLLNKESGLLGICDKKDMRDVLLGDDERSKTAAAVTVRRVKKYIGAYTALLGRVDAIVFTAGIGENAYKIREEILRDLDFFGFEVDREANRIDAKNIAKQTSKTQIFVIKTDEELEIARQSRLFLER